MIKYLLIPILMMMMVALSAGTSTNAMAGGVQRQQQDPIMAHPLFNAALNQTSIIVNLYLQNRRIPPALIDTRNSNIAYAIIETHGMNPNNPSQYGIIVEMMQAYILHAESIVTSGKW